MPEHDKLPLPSPDDRQVYDVVAMKYAYPTLAVSVEIGLYPYLAQQPRSLAEIGDHLQLGSRAVEAIVATVAAMGFLTVESDGRFALTPVARTYLLPGSDYFRADLAHSNSPDVAVLRRAVQLADEPPQPFAVNIEALEPEHLESFMGVIHGMTVPAACGLAEQPVFRGVAKLLDVAGGTGSLSIAIARRHPDIRCTIMDLQPVCEIARRHVRAQGFQRQIDVVTGDMFQDSWPPGFDCMLFGNIFHDWDPQSCQALASQAFEELEPGGTLCLHEMLLDEAKDGPLTVALTSIAMLLHEKGKQFTKSELQRLLSDSGFTEIEFAASFGYYWLVTATKPS